MGNEPARLNTRYGCFRWALANLCICGDCLEIYPFLRGQKEKGHRMTGAPRALQQGVGGYRSTHMATPMPPPMHSVAKPFFAPRRCISYSSVVSTRAPEAPIG